MKRLEIFANKSIEKELLSIMKADYGILHFTMIPVVHGQGDTVPKYGDDVWPEENFMLIIYCAPDQAAALKTCITALREERPDTGISLFELSAS